MNEQAIKEERERSARKQSEIDAEVNNNKEIVYNYIASHKDVSGKQCVEDLGFFEKGKRYLEWLSLHGHLVRMKRTIDGKRMYVYNAIKPYVKPVCEEFEAIDKADVEAQIAIKRVTRVFNLLDRPQEPKTKEDRERLRRSTKSVAIGSSMNMFRSW
jgi:hypothetical protein